MGPKKDTPHAIRSAALAKAKARNTKKPAGRRPTLGNPLLADAGMVRARKLAEERLAADTAARQAATATQAISDTTLVDRLAAMENRLAAMQASPRPDMDAIQGIGKVNLLPVDDRAPAPVPMSAGEIAVRKELSDLKDHTISVNTAFLASEERVTELEAKVTKKGAKGAAKAASQSRDTLLPESEDEGTS
jgi:hypothetical protein